MWVPHKDFWALFTFSFLAARLADLGKKNPSSAVSVAHAFLHSGKKNIPRYDSPYLFCP